MKYFLLPCVFFVFVLHSTIVQHQTEVVYGWNTSPTELVGVGRRSAIESVWTAATTSSAIVSAVPSSRAATAVEETNALLSVVTDPDTYSALAYAPPQNDATTPLILVLHGAGRNQESIIEGLANPLGEHAGLIPSLIAAAGGGIPHAAPDLLLEKFAVLAPYSYGKTSFYNDPRQKLLTFLQWAIEHRNTNECRLNFDPRKIIVLGFSDGATVAVELLTTRKFAAGVICSYGYTGKTLPAPALERLADIPMWVFHSADDVIFDVSNSDRLVQQLRATRGTTNAAREGNEDDDGLVRYSRFETDPENLPRRVRGHSMGITASKSSRVYEWMLAVPPIER